MPPKNDTTKNNSTKNTPTAKHMSSEKLTQKAAGYLLAASNAAKRENKK
jgi:hypothetical protein